MGNGDGDGDIDPVLARVGDQIEFGSDMAVVLFRNSPDAIVCVDDSGFIRMTNPQAELLFGYHHTEMRGQPVEMLIPAELKDVHQRNRSAFLEDPRVRSMGLGLDLRARRKNGTLVEVDINLSPVVTARGMFVVATIRRRRPGREHSS